MCDDLTDFLQIIVPHPVQGNEGSFADDSVYLKTRDRKVLMLERAARGPARLILATGRSCNWKSAKHGQISDVFGV